MCTHLISSLAAWNSAGLTQPGPTGRLDSVPQEEAALGTEVLFPLRLGSWV